MNKSKIIKNPTIFLVAALLLFVFCQKAMANDLPVLIPDFPQRQGSIRNPVTFEELHNIGQIGDHKGLYLNLGNPHHQGTIYTGPYPFEAGESDYDHPQFRLSTRLRKGTGLLQIDKFFSNRYNANGWIFEESDSSPTQTIGYRLSLSGLGFYDSVVSFKGNPDIGFQKNLTITEGPFVTMVSSDDPHRVMIAFETDQICKGQVDVLKASLSDKKLKRQFAAETVFNAAEPTKRHAIWLTRLHPDHTYEYAVRCANEDGDSVRSSVYSFHTAPRAGKGEMVFAFLSDSREGVGDGERNYMGHNLHSLSRLVNHAYRMGTDFIIFGGDMVNGYTSSIEDFRLQLRGWKQSMAGFWRSKTVYTAMGNHEALVNVFDNGSRYGIALDKWPYETSSAEAIFAEQFWNPENGPLNLNPRRPSYKENVYHFRYGPVLFIAFNNNYWWTTNKECKNYGGAPEGYIMADQLIWIEKILKKAEHMPKVKYIILFAQEPVFPAGGHVKDAMWWHGNNNVRAYVYNGKNVVPAGRGIIDVRNRFWKAVAGSSKVAAVLAGDEHAYHRIKIDSSTPVGIPDIDDLNGDDVLDRYSANPEFIYPTWHITAGTAGAPFYAQQDAPWKENVISFSSQTGYCLFIVAQEKISMIFYTLSGQKIDSIDNLMEIK
jgi:hypothetical protein